jgi:cell division protein FtsB
MSTRASSLARPRSRPTARAAILAMLVMVIGLMAIVPFRQYTQQRSYVTDLERKVALVERANIALGQHIGQLHDPEQLERLARECLGMVKAGEIAFVTVPRGGAPQPSRC